MQKMLRYCLATGIVMSLLVLAGCNKLFDYIKDHPDEANTACKIKKVFVKGLYDSVTAVIAYNSWGDPVSVTPDQINTGRPQRLFRYDPKHRLTDDIGAYENGYYEQWRRFVYDNNNRIIRDTAYAFGLLNDRTNALLGPDVTAYEYDAKGRLIHTSQQSLQNPSYPPLQSFYSYDSNGNLTGGEYDDKINFHRTSRIWMFLDRDYSVNNRKIVTGYNAKGLPLKLNSVLYINFLNLHGNTLEFTYQCD